MSDTRKRRTAGQFVIWQAGGSLVSAQRMYHPVMVRIKRVYEPAEAGDGYRVLVDRIWPRGVSKEQARLDEWLKEVAPTSELRRWFGHDPEKFTEFSQRYRTELADSSALAELQEIVARENQVTLVYGARDELHNQAVVLAEMLDPA